MVLFDLDGVFLAGDTMGSLVVSALRRRPWRLVPAAVLVAYGLVLPAAGDLRPRINRRLVRLGLHGLGEVDYEQLAAATAVRLAAAPGRDDGLVNEALRHMQAGSRVLVVTASERRLARLFLDRIGLAGVELVASELVFSPHLSLAPHNVGRAKVVALQGKSVDLSVCVLYTDSASDLPLMRAVAACVLVHPDRATTRAVERAGLSIPVTVWPEVPPWPR